MENKPELTYRYIAYEYRIYTCKNGRKYKVFKNGMVVSCAFEVTDSLGRRRFYEERKCKPTLAKTGYFEISLGGKNVELWLLHRLVATCFLGKRDYKTAVEHIDGNRGDNCVENLRWLSREEYVEKYVKNLNQNMEE